MAEEQHPPLTEPVTNSGDDWLVEVTPHALDTAKYIAAVTRPSAGAIAAFVGTTRDSFEGKRVLRLEYEAYAPMAVAKMKEVCEQARAKFGVTCIAIAHRTGTVGVAEASVAIAVSSPHRKPALEAAHWAIDELKATVPIWKKEIFEDGSVWKENLESRRLKLAAKAQAQAQ